MKAIVIYNSKTGFTETYAKWLAKALQCKAVPYAARGKIKPADYDAIIYGGGLFAGVIRGAGWFKKAVCPLQSTKKAVFAVGLTPAGTPEAAAYLEQNVPSAQFPDVHTFYMPGGLCYGKSGFFSRKILAILRKSLQNKTDKTAAEDRMLQALSADCDYTDRRYIEPLLDYLRGNQ